MITRTWKCQGCDLSFETYQLDPKVSLKSKLCGRCVNKGRNMTRIMVARREQLREQWKRNERWEAQRRKILGLA